LRDWTPSYRWKDAAIIEQTRTSHTRLVRTAAILTAAGIAFLVDAFIAFTQLADFSAATDAMLTVDRHAFTQIGEIRFTLVYNAVVGTVGALSLAMLAAGVYRRRRPARGAALIGALVLGLAAMFGLATDGTSVAEPTNITSATERAAIEALISSWYNPAHSALAGIALIGMAVSAVLLFRISSLDFYA
jgi:hypothetical protein